MTEVQTGARAANGDAPATMPETPEDFDVALIAQMRVAENVWRAYRDELRDQLDAANEKLRRYERSLSTLTGETTKPGPKQTRSFGPKPSAQPNKTRVSVERKVELERMVREYAADHTEFRQIDIRSTFAHFEDGGNITSSITALGFESLVQANVIRFARQDGNNKWYRLTHAEAANGERDG